MFIRAIVVPVLIVCLVLFVGVSFNNGNNMNDDMINENVENNNTDNIATTPSAITNRDDMMMDNNTLDTNLEDEKTNMMEYSPTLRETRIVNEIERINGIKSVRVRTNGSVVHIAALKDDNMTEISLKEEIRNVIRNIDSTYDKIYINFSENEYNSFNSGNTNNNFSSFESRSEVITVY